MSKLTVKGGAKNSKDFFRGNVTGEIYQRNYNGGFTNLSKGYHAQRDSISAMDLAPLPIGSIITIEVDK